MGGVEVVSNPAVPLYPDDAITVERTWSTPARGDEERLGLWEKPVAVRVGGERVYILDGMADRVHVVEAATGRWAHSIGRKGGGPGELEKPFGLAVAGGEVVVGDGGKASLERFGPDGEYLGALRLEQLGFSFYALDAESFLASSLLGREGGWKRLGRDGDIAPFPWPESSPAFGSLGAGCGRVSASNDTVFRLDCYRLAFQVMSGSGALLREVLVDRPAEAISEERLEHHLDQVRQVMGQSGLPGEVIERQLQRERERFRLDPKMRTARLDPENDRVAVWEQDPEDLGGGPARLHIFSRSGVYQASVDFGEQWVDFDWAASTIYALVREPGTDLIRLMAHRLMLPEEE